MFYLKNPPARFRAGGVSPFRFALSWRLRPQSCGQRDAGAQKYPASLLWLWRARGGGRSRLLYGGAASCFARRRLFPFFQQEPQRLLQAFQLRGAGRRRAAAELRGSASAFLPARRCARPGPRAASGCASPAPAARRVCPDMPPQRRAGRFSSRRSPRLCIVYIDPYAPPFCARCAQMHSYCVIFSRRQPAAAAASSALQPKRRCVSCCE